MVTEWPPQKGQLWLTMDRWPATADQPEIPGGALVLCLDGTANYDRTTSTPWWIGWVLHGAHRRCIRATEGDLIPADDPRVCATAA